MNTTFSVFTPKRRIRRHAWKVVLAVVVCLQAATAAAIDSTATGNWGAGATWDGGVEPTGADPARIVNDHTVTVNTAGEVANNVTVGGNGGGTLQMDSGTLTASGLLFVRDGGTYIHNGGDFVSNGTGINYVGNRGVGTLIVNGGMVDLTTGTFRTSQEGAGGISPRATIEIHDTGHFIVDGNALFSVRGNTVFIMDGGEFDAVSITFYGQYKLGQMTTWTQSGGQVDLTGTLTVRTNSDWQGRFDFTMEGGYGDGTNFNVGSLNLYTSPFNPATPSRLTALLDAGGIEPINVTNASTLAHTRLTDMELGVGALGGSSLADIAGTHDFIISTGPIDDANLTLVELASLTDLGGEAKKQIVDNDLGGQTLQIVIASPIPEPTTFVLAALGLLGLGSFGRRRRR